MPTRFSVTIAAAMVTTSAWAQDPQALMDALIQKQTQQYEAAHQSEMMRLKIERLGREAAISAVN